MNETMMANVTNQKTTALTTTRSLICRIGPGRQNSNIVNMTLTIAPTNKSKRRGGGFTNAIAGSFLVSAYEYKMCQQQEGQPDQYDYS